MSFARRASYRAPILAGPSAAARHDARGVVLVDRAAVSRRRSNGRPSGRDAGLVGREVATQPGRRGSPAVGGMGHAHGPGVGAVVIPFPVPQTRRAGRLRGAGDRRTPVGGRTGQPGIDPPLRLTRRGRLVVGVVAVLALAAAMAVGLFLPLP